MTHSARPQRRFWADTRFLIGIALILIAVGGVWLIIASARQTAPMLQANRVIAPGEPLSAADFDVVEVGLGSTAGAYLAPHDLDAGMVTTRTLSAGELLPRSAITETEASRVTRIIVESSVALPETVVAGTAVELWCAPPMAADRRIFDTPRVLLPEAVVAAVPKQEGVLDQQRVVVELVIDRAEVQAVLAAITDGSALSVVPLGAGS